MSRVVPARRGAGFSRHKRVPQRPWSLFVNPRAHRGALVPTRVSGLRAPLAGLRASGASLGRSSPPARARGAARARRAAGRRHLILGALFGFLVVAAALAVVAGFSAAWWGVAAVSLVACGYLGLLSWARKTAAEREFKLAFLPARAGATGLEELFSQPGESQAGGPRREPLRASSG